MWIPGVREDLFELARCRRWKETRPTLIDCVKVLDQLKRARHEAVDVGREVPSPLHQGGAFVSERSDWSDPQRTFVSVLAAKRSQGSALSAQHGLLTSQLQIR
jgi:hypothetical protein